MRHLTLWITLLVFALCLTGLSFFFYYQQDATAPLEQPASLIQTEKIKITEHDQKHNQTFILTAQTMVADHEHNLRGQKGVITLLKKSDTKAVLYVEDFSLQRKQRLLSCSTVTGSLHSMHIKTSACRYYLSSQQLEIPEPWSLYSKTMHTTGKQAVVDIQAGTITCDQGIKTTLRVKLKRTSSNHCR